MSREHRKAQSAKAVWGGPRRVLRLLRWGANTVLRRTVAGWYSPGVSLHVVGDSHAKFLFGKAPGFRVHYLGPVTMHRIARDGRNALHLGDLNLYDRDVAIWCLGEIDVRCHVVPQAQIQNVSVESVVRQLAERYLVSISEIQRDAAGLRTIILSIIPPTDQVRNEEYPTAGTLQERIDARVMLNRALGEKSPARGFHFLDPFGPFVDADGALKKEMTDGNVHVGPAFAPLVVEQVRALCAPWVGSPSSKE